jgi:hypothetical protein
MLLEASVTLVAISDSIVRRVQCHLVAHSINGGRFGRLANNEVSVQELTGRQGDGD